MYAPDAVSVYAELNGPGSVSLVNGTAVKTILGVSIQQSGTASQSDIKCGNDVVARNYGKDFPYNEIQRLCSASIIAEKTGQDSASYILTYVPRDITQYSTVSAGLMELGPVTLTSMHGKSWMIFMGIGLCLLAIGIRIGFMFHNNK